MLRAAPFHSLPFVRAIAAALLTIAVLASAVPFTVLSKAHSCSMPCCAGTDGGCATGACQGALFRRPKKTEEETLCGTDDARGKAHGTAKKAHGTHAAAGSSEDGDHCDSEKDKTAQAEAKPAAEKSTNTYGDKQSGSLSASALSAPCSRDCCAVTSSSVQPRRGRDSILASQSGDLPPPVVVSLSFYSLNLQPVANAYLKRLRARAPPSV